MGSRCDYLPPLPRIAPATSAKLLKAYGSNLTRVVAALRAGGKHAPKGCIVPDEYPFEEAVQLFLVPIVADCASVHVEAKPVDLMALRDLLVGTHGFNPIRVERYIARLCKAKSGPVQRRLDTFFDQGASPAKGTPQKPAAKRKREVSEAQHSVSSGWRCRGCSHSNPAEYVTCQSCFSDREPPPEATDAAAEQGAGLAVVQAVELQADVPAAVVIMPHTPETSAFKPANTPDAAAAEQSSQLSVGQANSSGGEMSSGEQEGQQLTASSQQLHSSSPPDDDLEALWACTACTMLNRACKLACEVCGTTVSERGLLPCNTWTCPVCTLQNSACAACDACGTKNPDQSMIVKKPTDTVSSPSGLHKKQKSSTPSAPQSSRKRKASKTPSSTPGIKQFFKVLPSPSSPSNQHDV